MDENGRWIKLHSKLMGSEVWQDETAMRLFLWCIFRANWKSGRVAGVEIQRGSFVTSVRRGAEDLEIHPATFHKALKRLVDYGCIKYDALVTKSGRHRGLHVTVCKYTTYQDDKRGGETDGRQPVDSGETGGRQPVDQIEEPLEEIEGKKIKTQTLVDLWNRRAGESGGRLSQVRRLTDGRKRKLTTRLADPEFADNFAAALDRLPHRNPDLAWQPTFDWMVANGDNVFKVLEGHYEPKAADGNGQKTFDDILNDFAERPTNGQSGS